jgi:hypothetical protein
MHIACWITWATDTHSEYAVPIAIIRQQHLRECASVPCSACCQLLSVSRCDTQNWMRLTLRSLDSDTFQRRNQRQRDPNFVMSARLCFLCWLHQQSCFMFNGVRYSYLAKVNMFLFLDITARWEQAIMCTEQEADFTLPRITALVFKRSHFRISAETTAILIDFSLFSSAPLSKYSNSTLIRR